jgi:hypothetical protein
MTQEEIQINNGLKFQALDKAIEIVKITGAKSSDEVMKLAENIKQFLQPTTS